MIKTTTKKYVYAADEFYKDPLFGITAISIKESQFDSFNKRWEKLRKEIRDDLIKDAPRLSDHKRLRDGKLPEIHAVDMFQSESVYRLEETDPGYREEYWLRQHRWLEAALKIVRHFQCDAFIIFRFKALAEINGFKESEQKRYEENFNNGKPSRKSKTFGRIVSNPYYRDLPIVISALDSINGDRKAEGEFIFDEYDYSKGFHEPDIIDRLREIGYIHSIYKSRHDKSEAHNILQAADVVSYFIGKKRYCDDIESERYHDFFNRNFRMYISDRIRVIFPGKKDVIAGASIAGYMLDSLCAPTLEDRVGPQKMIESAVTAWQEMSTATKNDISLILGPK